MINRQKLYDLIYDKADKLFKKYNPCEIGKNIFGEICCRHTNNITLCCTGCNYLSNNGCTVKCLACKLCLCRSTIDIKYSIGYRLHNLKRIAYKYGLYGIRISKKELMERSK